MPEIRGVAVAVVDIDGKAFKEWGVQQNKTKSMTSCYVQSEKNKQFRIRITPNIDGWDKVFASERYKFGVHDMLVTMRLDGKEKVEKQEVVYLDKYHPYFDYVMDGEVYLKAKKVQDEEGFTRHYNWAFKDVGIELLFDNLSLDSTTTTTTDAKESSTSGIIEITLDRIRVEARDREWTEYGTHAYDRASAETASSTTITNDQAHVATDTGGFLIRGTSHVIDYDYVVPEAGPWATYKFFYRSEEVLRKFGFEGFKSDVKRAAIAMKKAREEEKVRKRKEAEEEDEWYVSKSRGSVKKTE
ncbi:hypothetical protein CBER1_11588 [Cercospora berteroae]|uniref:DUF7918 domain-containing protein n=1 Tax=Cercospora berteroae TaxID=357750 RepID=A0A2S6C048_9PEZI|nr:hypothetical protein CBER1_11588 [Cercospora berteroae]